MEERASNGLNVGGFFVRVFFGSKPGSKPDARPEVIRGLAERQDLALAESDPNPRHLFTKRGPRQGRVEVVNVARGAVGDEVQDVLPGAVCASEAHERASRIVRAPPSKSEAVKVRVELVEDLVTAPVVPFA